MTFSYQKVRVQPSPGCPEGILYRPIIPVQVQGPAGIAGVQGLLDTGADETILPAFILREIGGKYEGGDQGHFRGVGGQPITVNYSHVLLTIEGPTGRYDWRAKVGFLEGRDVAILGYKGFLEYFTMNMNTEKHRIRLTLNKQFPGSAS